MFIVIDSLLISSSVRSEMLTLRPYGACIPFNATNYKHCVPNGTFQSCSLYNAQRIVLYFDSIESETR
jgi:hypothetical protein